MVRRGSRTGGPQSSSVNNTSSSSGSNEAQWKAGRADTEQSAADSSSLAKSVKSSDSAESSSPLSRHSSSPSIHKKSGGVKATRSSSNWRARGAGPGRHSGVHDSKFTITSEDFPALPGGPRGNGGTAQSTPAKYVKKDKEKHSSFNTDMSTTDDSGVSSSGLSRGNTPPDNTTSTRTSHPNVVKLGKEKFENKKKLAAAAAAAAATAAATGGESGDVGKKKSSGTSSPSKERPPRESYKKTHHQLRLAAHQTSVGASPKKKTINANAANTTPSFMKLSKVGQKIPERRGGGPRQNSHFNPSSATSPPDDKENTPKKEYAAKLELVQHVEIIEKKEQKKKEEPHKVGVAKTTVTVGNSSVPPHTVVPPSHCIFHPSDVPKIILGPNGELSNIPPTMLTDQFGMAAMLPILDIVKNRSTNIDESCLTNEELNEKYMKENIEMTTIGFDLNELGVPMKTQEVNNKTVWESFAGPFGVQPILPTSIGLHQNQVPSAYYTARTLQTNFDMLQNIPDKFGIGAIFYIFYNMPKEIWQLNAARELQFRGWRFNIREKIWVNKKLGESEEFADSFNSGQFHDDVMTGLFEIYDAEKARICSAEMTLRRSEFEIPVWEQKVPDLYHRQYVSYVPKEALWGPRDDRKNSGFMQGISGMLPNFQGRQRQTNLTIPKPAQSSERRLLSFADSPDLNPSFENPFGNFHPTNSVDDACRNQMYAMLLQKMQQHQQHQHQMAQQQHHLQQHHQIIAQAVAAAELNLNSKQATSSSNFFQK
ncbi:CRE-TAG-153 protein [Caenorhabditis remanei]|uniref:CRE-TAG-153 protein n=1 Tax=Caenorhabditis remanei TaxID=31234 RepID=E3MD96_CAERE|nr:CRE-TAG-153 protein [Caenorhabditis remanei]